jgi:hypothetical protein
LFFNLFGSDTNIIALLKKVKTTVSGLLFLISITVRVLIASNMRMHQHLWGAILATQSFNVVDDLSADIIFYLKD